MYIVIVKNLHKDVVNKMPIVTKDRVLNSATNLYFKNYKWKR